MPFLTPQEGGIKNEPFHGIFIRAPVVEKILPVIQGEQTEEAAFDEKVVAPAKEAEGDKAKHRILQPVEVMATLPGRSRTLKEKVAAMGLKDDVGDIVAVKQGNVFGTSFHPELTEDARIHVWWLDQVKEMLGGEDRDG